MTKAKAIRSSTNTPTQSHGPEEFLAPPHISGRDETRAVQVDRDLSQIPGRSAVSLHGTVTVDRADAVRVVPTVDPNERVRLEFGHEDFDRYFRGQARMIREDEENNTGPLIILVSSRFVADILRKRYGDVLGRICREYSPVDMPALDPGVSQDMQLARELQFKVDSSRFGPSSPFAHDTSFEDKYAASQRGGATRSVRAQKRPAITGRFTLDRFVTGNSNLVAYQAICNLIDAAVAEPGTVSVGGEVVFIHGPCGVGKTHLLQAAVGRVRELQPDARVAYTTAEEFTNGYLTALRGGSAKLDIFRARYRKLDLLCIDDVHFLAGKKGTQKELLHTLESIDLSGSRLAVASDHHPDELAQFSTPVMSRMRAGAVVGVDLPDESMRIDLIRHLAHRRGISIDMDAARILAASAHAIGSSARELDGLVSQAEVRARISGGAKNELSIGNVTISAEIARLVLATCGTGGSQYSSQVVTGSIEGIDGGRRRRPVRFAEILDAVCTALDVEIRDVHGRGRHPRVVLARAVVTRLARRLTPMSYPEIARGLARTNHSTFITADKRLGQQIEQGLRLGQVQITGEPGLVEMELSTFEDVLADRILRGVGVSTM
ncbi:MAG: ATP-binding protein [Phycisphaeraceae bacterium]|nr:ATP-binding protein [Phycisphaeraceae bacterium]